MGFGIQVYVDRLSGEKVGFQVASVLIELPESCRREWDQACSQGTMGKIVVSEDGISVDKGGLFYLDVDTRRAESEEEVAVNLSQLLPPFICVSVLFAVSDSYEGSSIGPHMDDILELSFSRQLAEWCKKNSTLQQLYLTPQIPISLCLEEPNFIVISPDQHLIDPRNISKACHTLELHSLNGAQIWPVSICVEPLHFLILKILYLVEVNGLNLWEKHGSEQKN